MSNWLYEKENYNPPKSQNRYIESSISAFRKLLWKFKHINSGIKTRKIYFLNPVIKSLFAVILISFCAYSRTFAELLYIFIWIFLSLVTMHKKDIQKCMSLAVIVFLGNFLILAPSLLMKNFNSITIVFKSVLMVLTLNIYVFTTKWNHITKVLKFFRIPDVIIFLLDITLKYIISFSEFSIEMLDGLKVRTIGKTNKNISKSSTSIAGSIFIKAKEQSEELFWAMECRGFSGEYSTFVNFKLQKKDLPLVLLGCLIITGYIAIKIIGSKML